MKYGLDVNKTKALAQKYMLEMAEGPEVAAAIMAAVSLFHHTRIKPDKERCIQICTNAINCMSEIRTAFKTNEGKVTIHQQVALQDSIAKLHGIVNATTIIRPTQVTSEQDIKELLKQLFD